MRSLAQTAMVAWRRLPAPVRAFAHITHAAVLTAAMPFRVAQHWKRGRAAEAPIIVAGLLADERGVGEGARLFAKALNKAAIAVTCQDVSWALAKLSDSAPRSNIVGRTVVSHLNPPELLTWLRLTGGLELRGRRHIGYWAWESTVLPPGWRRAFAYVDEVWCPSEFTASAVRAAAPFGFPVRVVPHPVAATPVGVARRAAFGLPADAVIVLTAFDLRSTAARKNPQGALDAFLVAAHDRNALLILKVLGGDSAPAALQALSRQVADLPNVRLVTDVLSSSGMRDLVASVDIVLSLHRSEGFGLLLAEAMQAGKAVIATGWSGNVDFLDSNNSILVPFTLTPVTDPSGHYADGLWAEPDIDAAATQLALLISDPARRRRLGQAAQLAFEDRFDLARWAEALSPTSDGLEGHGASSNPPRLPAKRSLTA